MAGSAQLIINIVANINQTRRSIDRVNRDVSNLNNNIRRSTSGNVSSVNSLGDSFLKSSLKAGALVLGVYSIGEAIGRTTNAGIEFIKTIDETRTAFKVMASGNIEMANELLSSVVNLSRTSPLSTEMVAKASQTLVAFGVPMGDVIDKLKQLGDVSRGNNERFDNLTLAFGQMTAAGRLMGQETLQFINAGFNPLAEISNTLAQRLGGLASDYMPTLKKQMEEGAISTQMVYDAFKIATSEGGRFNNAMQEMSKTFSGQMNVFKDNALIIIGGILKPLTDFMTSTFLPIMNAVMEKIIQMFGFFGIQIDTTNDKMQNMASDVNATTGALDDQTDSMKKLKKATQSNLQSFDQLHTLQKESVSDASGVSGVGGLSDSGMAGILAEAAKNAKPSVLAEEMNKAKDAADRLLQSLKSFKVPEFDFTKLNESLETLKTTLEPLGSKLWEGLKWGWDEVLAPLATYAVNNLIPTFIEAFASALDLINTSIEYGKPLLSFVWQSFLKPITSWTGGVAIDALDGLSKAMNLVNKSLEYGKPYFDHFVQKVLDPLGRWTGTVIKGALDSLTKALKTFSTWCINAGKWIVELIKNFEDLAFPLQAIILLVGGFLITFLALLAAKFVVVSVATGIWTAALAVGNAIMMAFKGGMVLVKNGAIALYAVLAAHPYFLIAAAIVAVIGTLLYFWETNEQFRVVVTRVWTGIKLMIDWAVGWLVYGFERLRIWLTKTLPNAFEGVRASGVLLFSLMGAKILSIFDNVKGAVIDAINWLIVKVNGLIEKLNAVSVFGIKVDIPRIQEIQKEANKIPNVFDNMIAGQQQDYNKVLAERVGIQQEINSLLTPMENVQMQADKYTAQGALPTLGIADMLSKIKKETLGASVADTAVLQATTPLNLPSFQGGMEEMGNEINLSQDSVNSLGNAIFQALEQTKQAQSNNTNTPVIQIDGNTIGKVIKPYIDQEAKRVGNALITTT